MSVAIQRQDANYLYQQVINMVLNMAEQKVLLPGEKLPSLRVMANNLSVSIPTVKQAYQQLEAQGKIIAKEKSGYYLNHAQEKSLPKRTRMTTTPVVVNKQALIEQVYDGIHRKHAVPLGIANPIAVASTEDILAKLMRRAMKLAGSEMLNYGPMDGLDRLKKQIAHRYLDMGLGVDLSELVITNGAQEALAIALQSVTSAGDVVAIESPCYFGIIELIENLGLKAIEIPVCPDDGIWLDDLAKAISKHKIKACVFSTSISNPLGSFMPDDRREQLVDMLEERGIVLIEDDVYGDLHFTTQRGKPAQCFSKKGLVITCSSFSKTAAPSYRVGWLVAGQYTEKVKRIKRALSCSSSLMNQWVLADFLSSGEYDRHLRLVRKRLQENKLKMIAAVKQAFGEQVRVSMPQGGCVVWLDLGKNYDAALLFHAAMESGVSITPGTLFSASDKYKSCIRLSYGLPWTADVEKAIRVLSQLLPSARIL
ncbi:PLP-dependent aminotransferase family protein [Pseudoalteromonas sp. T1lg65]|uniref:aminotransferase-like domain-containing protein n=1 Tax=Pseudoalteromonas sp. T1lg65 TaxID=2077101 RepID=UPI003F7AF7AD